MDAKITLSFNGEIIDRAKKFTDEQIKDFEDGMQYYAAVNARCECIISEDKHDYYFSKIETLSARNFIEKYVLKKSKA